ncbi:phosphatase PAP2 family protein [Flavihumibacter fluvii]|uniref:phosphatase PAP2 family protein n=1 Tax=Flavihumibacter fluvii TaxID=2838157 RepID=UPI001EFBC5B4|nr:phosphatase PAP2 family protein [Flavihumibacter fluvii]ULQ53795.1 phosphatase PAP2 family protein [Flavihumibacter fluvii]
MDKSTLIELSEDRTNGQTKFFQAVSNSTGAISAFIPAVLLIAGEIKGDKPMVQKALYIGESIAVSSVITWGLKYSINRPRPAAQYPGEIAAASTGGSPSFPSGHTSLAFSTATALYMAWPKWYIGVPAFTWAGLVSYSRMDLGVHYPSDILAGAVVGVGSAWLTYKANEWIRRKHTTKNPMTALR